MKAIITFPRQEKGQQVAICTVIPFKTVQVSIAMDNGVGKNTSEWCFRDDLRVYDTATDKDITKEVLGEENCYSNDGEKLLEILKKVTEFEKTR